MILIHGECGSGRTAALRALEAAPPPGFRAVYVPVPTLDLEGVARWCLDRLAPGAHAEPVAALRELAKRQAVLLLLDDAERLPIATAEALARLARESAGAITLICACETRARARPSLAALGAPEHQIALDASSPERAQDAARGVRGHLAPALRSAPAAALAHTARASARLAGGEATRPVPRAVPEAPSEPAPAARVREEAIPVALAAAPAARERRTVPLSLAIALAVAAFLIPVAFGAGLWLGRSELAAQVSTSTQPREPVLPAVAAPPPAEQVVRAPALAQEAEPESLTAPLAAPPVAPAAPLQSAPKTSPPEQAPRVAAAPAPERAPAVREDSPPPPTPVRARAPEPAAQVEEEWGTPALISVAPGEAGR